MSSTRLPRLRTDLRPIATALVLTIAVAGCATSPDGSTSARAVPADPPAPARADPAASKVAPADDEALASARARQLEEDAAFDLARLVLERQGARKLDADQREAVARALTAAATEHGFEVLLSLAIMQLESRFDPNARGPAGSIGLMQLQPATAKAVARRSGVEWRGEKTLRDPGTNARLGLAYLAELRARFGTTEHAIAAYNIGPGNLRRLLARRPLRRGPYLTKVFANVDALRQAYGGEILRD